MSAQPVDDTFRALADPNRREIISLLREREMSVQEIADAMPISRPAVSRHLKLLKGAGLVSDRTDGTRSLNRLEPDGVAEVHEYLVAMWGDVAARYRLAVENLPDPEGRS